VEIVFSYDLYQEISIQDSLIFEQPVLNKQPVPCDFWKENVKLYELQTTVRKKNEKIISILNRMRKNTQT
ncbi:hypothetical protein, partial [Bacteroides uniformis]|uniref:hypothetical protein n=1 Tax=Bacteroides uniformis TaxID=820 RepID=UPI001AA1C692